MTIWKDRHLAIVIGYGASGHFVSINFGDQSTTNEKFETLEKIPSTRRDK